MITKPYVILVDPPLNKLTIIFYLNSFKFILSIQNSFIWILVNFIEHGII